MGTKHFKQMHADATKRDTRALLLAVELYHPAGAELHFPEQQIWNHMPFDQLVDLARTILPLGDWYHDTIKDMLVTGKVRVIGFDQYGKPGKIRDPRVIDFDDEILPLEIFEQLLCQKFPGESCTHEQNL